MELGPIFRALMHNKSRFWLVTLEIALTVAIVANCVNMMMDYRREFLRPTGIDEENILVVSTRPFGDAFKEDEFLDAVEEQDVAALQALPGVAHAAGFHAIPLSGGGSATGRIAVGSELQDTPTPYYVVTADAVSTLGVNLIEGRDFVQADFDEAARNADIEDETAVLHSNIIVTKSWADAIYPDGDALGKQVQNTEGQRLNTIVGIMELMHGSWPRWEHGDKVVLFPGRPGRQSRMRYLVRTEPGAMDSVFNTAQEAVRAVNDERVIEAETLTEFKRDNYEDSIALIKMLGAVIFLLVFITSLGIVGLTSFSVTQRTRQIGTRRALGATRGDILRYFLVENWLITGIGLGIGILLTLGLNYALVNIADAPKMDWILFGAGAVGLWVTGILAALAPAYRATTVSPEIATRTV